MSWPTNCTARRNSATPVRVDRTSRSSVPLKVMVPEVGVTRPTSIRASVDLPEPDSPTMPVQVPSSRRLTVALLTAAMGARRPPKVRPTPLACRAVALMPTRSKPDRAGLGVGGGDFVVD